MNLAGKRLWRMAPSYWRLRTHGEKHNEPTLYETRYMRRKLEYLLRTTAVHPDGCCGRQGLGTARVVKVERLENVKLWNRYVNARNARRGSKKPKSAWVHETSRPIRCDLDDDERYFWHGTQAENVESILRKGFDVECASGRGGRYGDGIYFSDASCKSHQYAQCGQVCGGKVYCMLYCRVALGDTMRFNATKQAAERNYLVGMKRPVPGDPVFEQNVMASGGRAKARSSWHSLAVLGGSDSQVHREYVVFDGAHIYPEYVVYYRLDSEEEEASARQRYIDAAIARLEEAQEDREEFRAQRLAQLVKIFPHDWFDITDESSVIPACWWLMCTSVFLLLDRPDDEEIEAEEELENAERRVADFTPQILRPDEDEEEDDEEDDHPYDEEDDEEDDQC